MNYLPLTSVERGLLYLTATPSPTPGPGQDGLRPGLTADQVTPGLLGFVMTAFMVVGVVALMVSMTRRIRRVRYRAQASEGAGNTKALPPADGEDGPKRENQADQGVLPGKTAPENQAEGHP